MYLWLGMKNGTDFERSVARDMTRLRNVYFCASLLFIILSPYKNSLILKNDACALASESNLQPNGVYQAC
jgi:hypothetical protein